MLANDVKSASKKARNHNEPNRTFEVGEKCIYGNHANAEILESYESGKFYLIKAYGSHTRHSKEEPYEQKSFVMWDEIYKIGSFQSETSFAVKNLDRIVFLNSQMSSIISRSYDGVDFNPPYQRDLVWDNEDKILLLDSIFNNIDIGRFVFIKKDYSVPGFDWENDKFFEILDGKQRLTTLQEFYEDRLEYRGYFYSQLSPQDSNHFDNYPINYAEIPDPKDMNKIYMIFIMLNTFGKVASQDHISKIKGMIK